MNNTHLMWPRDRGVHEGDSATYAFEIVTPGRFLVSLQANEPPVVLRGPEFREVWKIFWHFAG